MISIRPEAHWCARHLEPFRARWPKGYLPACTALVQVVVRREEIIAAAGADAEMLDRVLLEFSPLCCLVGDEEIGRWTRLALDDDLEPFREAISKLTA